jgi:hypothetical protein
VKRTLQAFLLIVGVVVATMAGSAGYAALVSTPTSEAHLAIMGGVVRLGPSLNLHTNTAHGSVGFTDMRLRSKCYLRITVDSTPAERIVSAIAEEDEDVSRMGIEAGISGGAGSIDIYLYKNGHAVCANSKTFDSTANIWIQLTYLTDEPQDVSTVPQQPAVAPKQKVTRNAPTTVVPTTVAPTEEPSPAPTD